VVLLHRRRDNAAGTESYETDMKAIELVFISACIVYVYPYLVYPIILRLACSARRADRRKAAVTAQSVSHIVCAHNEEGHIEEKLANALETAPPVEYEIVLVCDGCTDRTLEIALAVAASQPRLKVINTPHIGKSAAQNLGVRRAAGDVLVFSDADTGLDNHTIENLLEDLGRGHACVGANVQYGRGHSADALYNRLEARLKTLQGALGVLIGVHGACYAVWKRYFTELDSSVLSDLGLPLDLLLAGCTVGFNPYAMALEHSARTDVARNLATRRRIFCRALTTLLGRGYVRRSLRKPRVFFHLVSDKVPRYFIGFLSVSILVLAALAGGSTLGAVLAGLMVICLLAAIPDNASRIGLVAKLKKASLFFIIVNLASLLAMGDYLSGRSYSRW
jgi:cellulose synthase/poly-beta-1,6-N-acetylglucosamine synthase-like glycosyltransferase